MAKASKTQYFDELLKLLDITEYYPEKLTREKLYEITPESLSSDKKSVAAVWQFIDKVTRYNYHARNIQTQNAGAGTKPKSFQEKRKIQRDSSILNVHPLDVLAAVFLCCDPIAKQDVVMHLWGCKLSIPFAIQPSKDERLLVYLWPLRCLIGQFQELDTWVETSLIDKSMKSVAFLRVGENEYSKSSLLNSIIGGSEKPHPMFFNRNSEGSKRQKSDLTNGLVEIGWFLSSDNDEGQLTKPHIFFNLRGDATKNLSQVELIGQLATVTIVLCSLCNLENSKGILKILCENKSRIIILISDQKPDFAVISTFLDNSFSHLSETQMDIITIEEDMICEVLESLHHVVSKMESDDGRDLILSDFAKNLPTMKYRVDETEIHFTEAFEISSDILKVVRDTKEEKRKDTLLPLQERFWKKWAQMDRDLARFDQLDPSKRKRYGNITNLQKDMFKTRQSQYFHLKKNGLSAPMRLFVGAFVKLNFVSRKIFLRMVKLQLDILSRKTLKPFYDEYQELLKQTIDATEHERISIQKQLLDLDTKKAKFSFGLEHFIRELGQIYEACLYHSEDNISIFCGKGTVLPYEEIPRFACLALLEGYPVEILDGEACYVPTRWIKGVFSILPQCLDVQKPQVKSKVYVISVLGIQSSGKSTFLNTTFGLQFAVSAGRCTEGVYMQLIKLHKSLDSNAEYILAIDTEGLKAAKLTTTESIQHDNEMSTFVIGLADTTVINLMGENATYLQENLPIAVHAFLRMNLVGLHPRCNIVHHNVDERNRQKLLEQTRILENCLNQLTSTACEVEQIPRRLFKDIIKFNITDHTDYIPALFEGGQPMAPINIGYSKQSDKVRKKLIEFMPPYDEMFSLTDFSKHIEILWNAINKDSFVFEFKTTLETEAKLDLDKGFFQILKQFLEKVDEKAVKYKRQLITCKSSYFRKTEEKYYTSVKKVSDLFRKQLKEFLSKPKKVVPSNFEQWKRVYMQNFEEEIKKNDEVTSEQVNLYREQNQPSVTSDQYKTFIKIINKKSQSRKLLSHDDCFHEAWKEWSKSPDLDLREPAVLTDTTRCLQEVCHSGRKSNLLEENTVSESSLFEFVPTNELHLNHSFHKFSESKIKELLAKMNGIKETVIVAYKKELMQIREKKMTYTYKDPKQILLKTEDILRQEIEKVDPEREISSQFKIDLLLATAGTIVKDLTPYAEEGCFSVVLKRYMHKLTKITINETMESSVALQNALLLVAGKETDCNIASFAFQCVSSLFEQSNQTFQTESKQSILGWCLLYIVSCEQDSLLLKYSLSPKEAVYTYLSYLIQKTVTTRDVKKYILDFVRNSATKCLLSLDVFDQAEVQFQEVLNVLLSKAELRDEVADIVKCHYMGFWRKKVYLPVIRSNFEMSLNKFIDKKSSKLSRKILNVLTDVCHRYATVIVGKTIGCTEECPFCREICKYSSGHPGEHECFVHRPVGCSGKHWSGTKQLSFETCTQHIAQKNYFSREGKWIAFSKYTYIHPDWKISSDSFGEPSNIWKWIFVNKYSVLKNNFTLPDNLPENWTNISAKHAKRAIQEHFNLQNIKTGLLSFRGIITSTI